MASSDYAKCDESNGLFIPCEDTATTTLVYTPTQTLKRYCERHAAWILKRFPHCYRPLLVNEVSQ